MTSSPELGNLLLVEAVAHVTIYLSWLGYQRACWTIRELVGLPETWLAAIDAGTIVGDSLSKIEVNSLSLSGALITRPLTVQQGLDGGADQQKTSLWRYCG